MLNRTIFINPIEPAKISLRSPLGVPLDLTLAFLTQLSVPVDPDTLLPQIVLMPRSFGGRYAYDLETVSAELGTASVTLPGPAMGDQRGYTIEVYQRVAAVNPEDPPVPAGMIACGTLATQGLAYQTNGPLAPMAIPVIVGPVGPQGPVGPPNILSIGSVTESAPGGPAEADITGTSPAQVLNLIIPRGEVGPVGPPNVLTVGTVTTGAPGTDADVDITGTSPAQVVNFTIPRGDVGEPNTLTVGSVTTLPAGSPATVNITGAAPNQTIDFGIPQGIQGVTGANVTLGTVLPGTAVDGALFWNTSTDTLYVRESGAWVIVEAVWGT